MPNRDGTGRLPRRSNRRLTVEIVAPPAFPVRGLAAWLVRVAPAAARGEMTVALVSDRHIVRLNTSFRGINTPTDVLSFPSDAPPHLGDVVIARGVARRQAARAGHSLATELRVLALHGLLHLLGYDHERDDGQMAGLERRLRRKGGLMEGLIERAR
jgi:probable rRNA maturation factor